MSLFNFILWSIFIFTLFLYEKTHKCSLQSLVVTIHECHCPLAKGHSSSSFLLLPFSAIHTTQNSQSVSSRNRDGRFSRGVTDLPCRGEDDQCGALQSRGKLKLQPHSDCANPTLHLQLYHWAGSCLYPSCCSVIKIYTQAPTCPGSQYQLDKFAGFTAAYISSSGVYPFCDIVGCDVQQWQIPGHHFGPRVHSSHSLSCGSLYIYVTGPCSQQQFHMTIHRWSSKHELAR